MPPGGPAAGCCEGPCEPFGAGLVGILPNAGGAPLLSRWKALIFAARSAFNPPPALFMVLCCGIGFRAALREPRGVDEGVIPAVVAEEDIVLPGDSLGGTGEDD